LLPIPKEECRDRGFLLGVLDQEEYAVLFREKGIRQRAVVFIEA
jgi:hypothetical protein